MVDAPDVVLVSRDLLLGSRLRAALAGVANVRIGASAEAADAGAAAAVFVDLNEDAGTRVELIRRLAAARARRVIGFCGHDERALRVRAMAAGADQVVTNGALQEAARRLLGAGAHG